MTDVADIELVLIVICNPSFNVMRKKAINPVSTMTKDWWDWKKSGFLMVALRRTSAIEHVASRSHARRSKLDVEIDMLTAISERAFVPTHIMYRSNLSWAIMQGFLKELQTQGLIKPRIVDSRQQYHLTEKGNRVIRNYMSVKKQLEKLAPHES